MVIIATKEGQLANRIYHASCFIVNAQAYQYHIRHLFFDDYYSYFSESLGQKRPLISFLGKKPGGFPLLLRSIIIFFVKALIKLKIKKLPFIEIIDYRNYGSNVQSFDLTNKEFIKKAKSKFVFVLGWLFRDDENYSKNRSLLLDTWQPNKKYQHNIKVYYERYKKGHDVLVGVHIRRGDYKNFEGGKWYYHPDQYYSKIKEIAKLKMFEGKKIAYVICTNEKDLSFPGDQNFTIYNEQRHFVEDMYLLSKCDYIIGPPSTFSGWASFYGNVPLFMLKEITTQLSDEAFASELIVV